MADLGAVGFSQRLVAGREKIVTSKLVDNVFSKYESLDMFRKAVSRGSGDYLRANIEAGTAGTTTITDESGTFSTAKNTDILGAVVYGWSRPIISKTRLDFMSLERNKGKEALVKLGQAHMRNVEKQHGKHLVSLLHVPGGAAGSTVTLDGTAYTRGANGVIDGSFEPLDVLVSETYASGGINPADAGKGYWKATEQTSSAAAQSIRVALRGLVNEIEDTCKERPDTLLVGTDIYDEYENSLDEQIRFTNPGGTANTRFQSLAFGAYTLTRDAEAPKNVAYGINTAYLIAEHLEDNFMKMDEAQRIVGTLDWVTPTVSVLAVGTTQRRAHGKLTRTA